jgi:hypothetical protein
MHTPEPVEKLTKRTTLNVAKTAFSFSSIAEGFSFKNSRNHLAFILALSSFINFSYESNVSIRPSFSTILIDQPASRRMKNQTLNFIQVIQKCHGVDGHLGFASASGHWTRTAGASALPPPSSPPRV